MLHVGDPDGTTKRSKIQLFLDLLSASFQRAYTSDEQVAVNECVITFKGRVGFRQYLKGKPHPWGIKAYVLSDSQTGYLHQLLIYYGKETMLVDKPDLGHTVRVVLTLATPLAHKVYILYTDRLYTSPILAAELEKMEMTLTGTVQSNRRGLPEGVKGKCKGKKGEVRAFRSGNQMVLTWTDKRRIIMFSTKHSNNTVEVPSR